MKKKIIYLIAITLLAASCASDDKDGVCNTLSGDGNKTPLSVTALLDAGGATTRAADKDFVNGDNLLAYLRHVKWDGSTGERTLVSVQNSPKLVTFTKGTTDMAAYNGDDIKPIGLGGNIVVATTTNNLTNQTADLTASPALYWDDFSANSDKDGTNESTYLRDEDHYLQSYYGYCFNGGEGDNNAEGTTVKEHITTALTKENGTLGWQVATDQTANGKSAFQHSDLLWSAEQTPISYVHQDQQGGTDHGTLILPYTHAMSKVTINVKLDASFGDGAAFSGVTTTLHNMFTHCTCTAPTYTLTNKGTETDITMWNQKAAETDKSTVCTFEAIVVPSVLSVVNNFATITGLDGNKYVIPITEAMLQKGSEHDGNGWGDELTETDEHINNGTAQKPASTRADGDPTISMGKGYEMKSGVNYVLNVDISKQQITVSATIKDWVNVEATGTALVQFYSDVTGKQDITDQYLKDHGFDVYKNSVNTAFTNITTKLTWDNTYSKWKYLVPNNSDWIEGSVYWAGQDDASYFRALSPSGATLSMDQGTDKLWGYACDDHANNGSKVGTPDEVKITPRTGDVPLHFEHPMSKISVNLTTSTGASAVDLTNADIEICNIATSGTLSLVDGSITPSSIVTAAIPKTKSISNLPVIPQNIGDAAYLKITLKDGTTYKLQLNTCYVNDGDDDDDNNVKIGAWQRGRHYTYTIQVDKEAIIFRALIKDWEEKTGSGNANLEWD